ncbi:MAG: glycosyltransferase family 4 protein [Candidatus Heimdallarchaeota archaeon]|nr:glycosyltransferase family 4 protein [Candidatus Heimdallarchaeota archaeon]MDH5647467.1 glycosyltransferase family 4 protein [Candidatus Heimdallarchaeota archaeon]
MKVALIVFSDPEGHPGYWPGMERLSECIIKTFTSLGVEITLITSNRYKDLRTKNKISLKCSQFGLFAHNINSFSRRLNEIDLSKFEIIQVIGSSINLKLISDNSFTNKMVSYFAHFDVYTNWRDYFFLYHIKKIEKLMYGRSKAIILGVPKNSVEEMEFFNTIKIENKIIINSPEGVIFQEYNGKSKQNSKIIKILYVGPLTPRKGVSILINSFESLSSRMNNLELSIVGSGYLRNKLEKLSKSKNLEDKIKFYGYISDFELKKVFLKHDIFAFPSLKEGYPLAPIEAMASGLPVVSFNLSSLIDIVGDTGFVANLEDQFSFTQSLEKAINCDFHHLGEMARLRIGKFFDWNYIISNYYLPLYQGIVKTNIK